MIPHNTHLYINETSVYKYIYKLSNDCIKMEITLFCVRSFQDKVCIMENFKKVDIYEKKIWWYETRQVFLYINTYVLVCTCIKTLYENHECKMSYNTKILQIVLRYVVLR